jgi:elongation factor P
MTIGYGDLKRGMPIDLDGEPYVVVEYERSKMQQRAPVMRVRFRSLRTGRVTDKTFQGFDVKLRPAAVDRRKAQYIYQDGDLYYFMDQESYEQFPMDRESIGDSLRYMVEEATVDVVFHEGQPIATEMPITVDLKVASTEPGFKGNTAQGGTKPATLETGLLVQVPLFIDTGETIRVDTRSGEYLSRV